MSDDRYMDKPTMTRSALDALVKAVPDQLVKEIVAEASSRTPPALQATACSAPLAQPERTGLTARRVTLHRTASEPLDRSTPGTGVLVRIGQRNRCTLSGVAHRQVARQGFPCSTPLRIGRRHDDPTRTSNPWFSSSNLEPRRLEEQGKKEKAQRAVAASSESKP